MTAWGEVNQDALSIAPNDVSRGKRLGFLDALEAAYSDESFNRSQFGAEVELRNMEQENLQRVQKASGIYAGRLQDSIELPKSRADVARGAGETETGRGGLAPDFAPYTDVWRSITETGQLPPKVLERDKQLAEMKSKYPDAGILTYGDMIGALTERAKQTELRASRDTSWSGLAGWFIGGVAGATDPRTNPINFLSLGLGAAGGTPLLRIGSQAIGQGAAETIAQYTGARENRQFLEGRLPTTEESLLAIGGAAIGGAAIQGVGEAAGLAARRWFRHTPDDPAPPAPVPPAPVSAPAIVSQAEREVELGKRMAPTLEGEQAITRAVQETLGANKNTMRAAKSDFSFIRDQLSPFNGPMPWEVPPPTFTRATQFGVDDFRAPKYEPKTPGETVDDIARRVDPETFKIYDNLAARRQEAQTLLDQRGHMRDLKIDEQTAGLRAEIAKQEKRLETAKRRKAKDITAELERLRSKLADVEQNARTSENVGMDAAQKELDRLDEKVADMSPALARAYSRAQGKWETQQTTLEAVRKMIADGNTEINMPPHTAVDAAELQYFNRPATIADSVPELRSPDAKPLKEGQDAVDEVARLAQETMKRADELLDSFTGDIKKMIKPAEKAGEEPTIQIEGVERPVQMSDTMVIEREDGTPETLTVRDYLKRLDDDEEILKAVTTCSAGVISATA